MILVEIPDRVRAAGMLLPREGLLKIRAPRSGRLESLLVANGTQVDAGTPIMRIADAQHAPGEMPEIKSRIVSLQRELQAQNRAAESELTAARERLQHNRERHAIIGRQILAVTQEIAVRESQLSVREAQVGRMETLAATHTIPRPMADAARLDALQAAAANHSALQKLFELEERQLVVEMQLDENRSRIRTLRDRSLATVEAITRQIESGRLQSSSELVAARRGVISGCDSQSRPACAARRRARDIARSA